MAEEVGLSHTTIRRIWNAFGLQPHRAETFKLSTAPFSGDLFPRNKSCSLELVDKVQDVVGLYMSPPNRAIVLCVDEKSQIQALEREQPVLPVAPGVAERRTHTYTRNGTTSLFAALDIATGAVIGKCYKRHRATEFLDVLKERDRRMPAGKEVHLVMDSEADRKTVWGTVFPLNAPHKTARVKAWLARRPHWHVHFTPTSASWLNQVERVRGGA